MKRGLILIYIVIFLIGVSVAASAKDYHVGQGQAYISIGAVPWYSLSAGDTVYIHPGVYHEKFLISTRGAPQKPIRVLGVLDDKGNRPVIDGQNATTSSSNRHHWQDPTLVQRVGIVFISIQSGDAALIPGYIEIKNLEIKNGYMSNRFSAENGTVLAYDGFAAGIYIRSAEHILIENCVIHDNGQAIYNWTGSGTKWWDGLAADITIRGNYFYNNGRPNSYTEHQTYTEADGVIIEYNHYGPQRSGAWGSHLKDRSAGTVIRYNYFDSAPRGWVIDLVEPQESWSALAQSNKYKQAFVYGNLILNNGNYSPNYFHWNEDHQMSRGRANMAGGKLLFYNNTILTIANQSDTAFLYYFNSTWGGYECSPGALPGIIDIRNNIFAVLPRTTGQSIPVQQFTYCNNQNLNFGINWVSPGWTFKTRGTVTGAANVLSSRANNPGFVHSSNPFNLHLLPSSEAKNKGGGSAPEITSNYFALDLTPIAQYVAHQTIKVRRSLNDLGAYETIDIP
jgi:hypothetical protein